MSQTELNRQAAAAEIAITGKRLCQTCSQSRDAHTGKSIKINGGGVRWVCAVCAGKIRPPRAVK